MLWKTGNKRNEDSSYLIIELLASGMSKEILEEYPELSEEDVRAALLYALGFLKF